MSNEGNDLITIHKPGNGQISENKFTKEEIKEKRMNRMVYFKLILRLHFLRSEHQITLLQKFLGKMDTVKKLIGGLLE